MTGEPIPADATREPHGARIDRGRGAPGFVAFFVDRPIFASVVAILIVLAGAVSIPLLPVAQFPPIAPPTVQVTAQFTGASADVIERTVTLPIEEQVNGVEGMLYMSSTSSNDGRMTLTVTFELGRDPDIATVNVNNRVAVVEPRLPQEVSRFGVTVRKQSPDLTMVVNVFSPDRSRDPLFLSNYTLINISDALKRVPGVGEINILGERRYAMRIWLDPDRLAKLELGAADVVAAVREQNLQMAAGLVGSAPAPGGQQLEFTLATKGRLASVEEFQDIVVRAGADGSVLRLGDVARVELGAQSYSGFTKLSGRPSTTIGIFQLPTANALDVAAGVESAMRRLAGRFPAGVDWAVVYDPTEFVSESIREVLRTLLEAAALVFLVVFLFLQDWRATLVPAVTIPVSLVGTFAFMAALGLTTNTITLFGLVLAIGLVVDDAIVVVESVSRLMALGRTRREAVLESMGEVSRAIVAATLVLAAVFVPVAFLPGTTGRIYQQFGLAVTCAFVISLLNALTLSPALCALLLQPERERKPWPFRAFDRGFGALQRGYEAAVRAVLPRRALVIAGFALLSAATLLVFRAVPTGFMPDEDQGYFVVSLQLPDGAALERTERVSDRVERLLLATPGIRDTVAIGGFDLLSGTNPTNAGTIFAGLAPWSERGSAGLSVDAILAGVRPELGALAEAQVFALNPPPLRGVSSTGGFEFQVQDPSGGDLRELAAATQRLVDAGNAAPELAGLFTSFRADVPQYFVELDRVKAKMLGVSVTDVFETLQTYLGAVYVNDFDRFGRVFRVFAQAESDVRATPDDVRRLYARSSRGEMVPLATLLTPRRVVGPRDIPHYNVFRAARINGAAAPGYSSGEAIAAMERLAREILPARMSFEWTGVALQEIQAGNAAAWILGLSLVVVFLFLAAQYESWSLPLVIMLSVPLAFLGALGAQWARGLANDVYCQLGLVTLIGLASKNAILIVEFAKRRREEGAGLVEAALAAARTRFRPVLMTALAFILGVVPLVIASGAGAAARQSLGTAVFGGMILATLLTLVLVPSLYVIVQGASDRIRMRRSAVAQSGLEPHP
jgi:hydrophobe/amphiphile efflux-1 (HAE1) family protein